MTPAERNNLYALHDALDAAYAALRCCDGIRNDPLSRLLDQRLYPGDLDELAHNIRAIADANDTGTNQ
jgi:hypothetical protein